MALFEVPGWTVPSQPVATQPSKKRKRPASSQESNEDQMHSAQINVEKLMKRLGSGSASTQTDTGGDGQKKKRKRGGHGSESKDGPSREPKQDGRTESHSRDPGTKRKQGKKDVERGPSEANPTAKQADGNTKKKKRKGSSDVRPPTPTSPIAGPSAVVRREPRKETPADAGAPQLTALQTSMKKKLDGARFRWINEMLYKSDSEKAHELMSSDPTVFSEYHAGFRHQVETWPNNPVSHYISKLSGCPPRTVIADLGCGDAALARALVPKGLTVLSFDLTSDGAYVVEADTCTRVPLPGAERHLNVDIGAEDHGEGQVVDVVVCALSLMGTNWPGCIREAWRVLKPGGELLIAEVTSRFTDVEDFVAFVSSFGFKSKSKDERNTHFTLFEFKKVARKPKSDKEWAKMLSRGALLQPCEYKRR